MSAVATTPAAKSPKVEYFQTNNLGPVFFSLMIFGGVSLLVFVIAAFFPSIASKRQILFSLLFAYSYFFTISAGCLFWVLVHHATDAEWSVVVRRILETLAQSFKYGWVFFLPLLLFAPRVWAWLDVPVGRDPVLDPKRGMLNYPFWVIRWVLIVGGFALIGHLMRKWSTAQDKDGNPKYTVWMRKLAFGGIPYFAIGLTFGAIDWLMSLDYYWFSTMWGVYIFAGSAWAAMATLIIVTVTLRKAGYLEGLVSPEHYQIMGKLLLAFTIFWAYIGFGQYFLIWYANIPEETSYFLRRNAAHWNWLSTALVVLHFFVPFLLLLSQSLKRNPNYLRGVAIYCLVIHALDHYIIVMPALHFRDVSFHILDLAGPVMIGCTLVFFFLKNLAKFPLYPLRDPRLKQSINLKN
jgi:hypothetical protein